jgi:aldehyde:ferredoxin oxidoreductase
MRETTRMQTVVTGRTIGRRGLAAEILLSELLAGVDSLRPENKVLFVTAPFSLEGGLSAAGCPS